ncbi:hypothetical protein NM897_17280 (plasmid) [Planococcus maritimus]|uniref:hypothetical protein n=1 Tax=Planococcus maritimus TaxID=192421 RepID=UPI003138F882
MKVDQISIFNFVENDEIKDALKLLEIGQEVRLLGYEIRLTDYGYEIENEDEHIGFLSFDDCYTKINK